MSPQSAPQCDRSTVAVTARLPFDRVLDQVLSAVAALAGAGGDDAVPLVLLARALAWTEEQTAVAVTQAIAADWLEGPIERPRLAARIRTGAVVGLDLGGTKLIGAVADMTGRVLHEIQEATWNGHDGAAFDQIIDMTHRLAALAGLPVSALSGVSVGVPGAVSGSGTVSLAPNLKIGAGTGLVQRLSAGLGVAARVENDVNIAAFGEYWRGEARGVTSLAFLALGTGVGMGLVLDGVIYRGETGGAGEIGYLPVGAAPLTNAPHRGGGYFEDMVGSEGIRSRYGSDVTVREIFARAEGGEAKACTVIEQTAKDTALGVAGIAMLLDPALIVLGGGIGSRAKFAAMVEQKARHLAPTVCPIVPSTLGSRAGLIGAVMLALTDARRNGCAEDVAA
ncbi:MAG: ROK family protein [Azospirillaceae bacterium]|nr:ROK family protein [Azospirillaceae bacterium]